MAVFTICAVCLLLTEVLPNIYTAFVRLSDKEWKVFVSSIGYQSRSTGAPILAIFAAGSLTAILAFACPLSHLIKLLNATMLVKCVLVSCDAMATRYRPDVIVDSNGDLQGWISKIELNQLFSIKCSCPDYSFLLQWN